MAKLINNDGKSFTFDDGVGRRYCVPFFKKLTPRSPTARKSGMLHKIEDDGRGRPSAKWATKPKGWIEFESLAKDYNLEVFLVAGEALPSPRPVRNGLVELSVVEVDIMADEAALRATVTDAGMMLFRGTKIGLRGEPRAEQLCLTDMWRANGSDPSKRPVEWMRSKQAQDLCEHLADSVVVGNSHPLVSTEKGTPQAPGSTWAHWQLAFAYAKYLSPAFHTWVNQAAREKMDRRPAVVTATDPALLELLRLQQNALASLTAGQIEGRAVAQDAQAQASEARAFASEAREAATRALEAVEDLRTKSKTEPRVATVTSLEDMSVFNALKALGLPRDKEALNRFTFAKVLFRALEQTGHAGRTWPVPKDAIERSRPVVARALTAMRRDGFSVSEAGLLTFVGGGRQFTTKTLVEHMLNAMRREDGAGGPSQTSIAGLA